MTNGEPEQEISGMRSLFWLFFWEIHFSLQRLVPSGFELGSDNDGTQCNGDYVTHPSSTVCLVNPSIQDPSVRVDGLNPE